MWENTSMMFPTGRIPGHDDITINDLIDNEYEFIETTYNKLARNMLIEQVKTTWCANGDTYREVAYSVWGPHPDADSCLSCFGAKMVQDWYQREQYNNLQEAQTICNAGFNYTGL